MDVFPNFRENAVSDFQKNQHLDGFFCFDRKSRKLLWQIYWILYFRTIFKNRKRNFHRDIFSPFGDTFRYLALRDEKHAQTIKNSTRAESKASIILKYFYNSFETFLRANKRVGNHCWKFTLEIARCIPAYLGITTTERGIMV